MANIPREMPDMTPAQRRDNWWRYHWLYVLIGVLAVIAAAGIAWEHLTRTEYDCGVALVTRYAVTPEELSALKTTLEAAAEDSNGDGRVQVAVNDIQIDYTATDLDDTSIRQMTTNVDKLHADFYTGQSGVFILDDPENFQRNHAALLYLDGSEPAEDVVDWENMVRFWNDSPVLIGLTFRNLDTAFLYLGQRIGDTNGADLWNGLFPDG